MTTQQDSSADVSARRWYVLAAMTLMYTCHYIDRSVVALVFEPIKREFGLSDSHLGVLAGLVYGTAFAITGVPLGFLADRVNRVRLIAAILGLWSLATSLCSLAANYTALIAARFTVGAAESGGVPVAMSLLSDYFPKEQRPFAVGVMFTASTIGTVICFLAGSYVVTTMGWRAAFLVAGLPGLILGIVIILTIREPTRGQFPDELLDQPGAAKPTFAEIFRAWRANTPMLHTAAAQTISTAIVSATWFWAASYFIRECGLDLKQAGKVVALSIGVFASLGTLLSGSLGSWLVRGGTYRILLVPMVTNVGLTAIGIPFAYATTTPVAIALFCAWCLLAPTFIAPGFTMVLGSVPAHMRGVTTSMLQIISNFAGVGLGSSAVGFLSDHFGGAHALRPALAIVICMGLWASLHCLLAFRGAKRRLQAEPGRT